MEMDQLIRVYVIREYSDQKKHQGFSYVSRIDFKF